MKRTELKRKIRHRRIRAKVQGTNDRPRLSVFRSNLHISAQLIDDTHGITLVEAHDQEIKRTKASQQEKASAVGKLLAAKALEKKIQTVVFDRSGYAYHGKVKALAEAARKGGLQF